MISEPQNNNLVEEYDLSILDEINHKEFNLQETLKELVFYLLPVFSFLFFLIILFSAVIPNISSMNTKLDKIEALRKEEQQLNTRIAKIRELEKDAANNQEIIKKINIIVPTGNTEVVKFGERIRSTIKDNGLINTETKLGESVLVQDKNQVPTKTNKNTTPIVQDENVLSMSEIPTKFDIKGDYENIRTFFKLMYKSDDFFIVDKMSLKKNDANAWSGEVSLAKYQFGQSSVFDPKIAYGLISENIGLDETVMQFLQTKFIDNVFENTPNTLTPTPTP